jgi:predicted ribosomally synthesized peptide with SipW-like signal peptide
MDGVYMNREKLLTYLKFNKQSLLYKKIFASMIVILLIAISISGATYAWFTYQVTASDSTFTAGTVQLSTPQIIGEQLIKPGSAVKHGFVPNSGEASISKVDLTTYQEIARYYTAPRLNDLIENDLSPDEWVYNEVDPYDWRTSRIAQDSSGNPWVLNVGAERDDLQGSVVRVQANTAGLSNTHSFPNEILPYGSDEAVQVFPVGNPGDMPRAVAIDNSGYIWVGFYSGGYLQKYEYNPAGPSLEPVGGVFRYGAGSSNNIKYYEMKFAPDGTLWISSRDSTPGRPGTRGVFSFNENRTPNFIKHADFNPYSILINEDTGQVYASSYSNFVWVHGQDTVTIPGATNLRGMAFDNSGRIWIANTAGASGGNKVYWYNPADNSKGHITLNIGNTPVGVGIDPSGNMWAVCRTDDLGQGFIEAFDPETKQYVNHIEVGRRPYAYGDFTLIDNRCKTVEWQFTNEGTKKTYVRVKPTASLNGNTVKISLCDQETNWKLGSDGWYYYGDEAGPTIVHGKNANNQGSNQVNVCFKYCFAADTPYNLTVKLEAQAVQSSNNAIDYEWVVWDGNNNLVSSHPWFTATQSE